MSKPALGPPVSAHHALTALTSPILSKWAPVHMQHTLSGSGLPNAWYCSCFSIDSGSNKSDGTKPKSNLYICSPALSQTTVPNSSQVCLLVLSHLAKCQPPEGPKLTKTTAAGKGATHTNLNSATPSVTELNLRGTRPSRPKPREQDWNRPLSSNQGTRAACQFRALSQLPIHVSSSNGPVQTAKSRPCVGVRERGNVCRLLVILRVAQQTEKMVSSRFLIFGTPGQHHFGRLVHLVLHWHLPRNLIIRLELQAAPMACALDSSSNKNSLPMLTEKVKKISRIPASWGVYAWSIGREDQRRAIHALKVGTALTLVSLLYILEPLFKGVGKNAMWAVITVVVVLEFTAGATICKGLNRGFGTVIAASLAFIIELVAVRSGKVFRGLFVGSSVFLIGFAATYLRFFPSIKKHYDYGVVIFLLTFNLITVSSFRQEDVLPLARDRLSTIAIGCAICLFMSLFVLPNWSGEDLHTCTVRKFEGLARSVEACVNEYFRDQDKDDNILDKQASRASIHTGYRAVLDSKSSDETLAHYASWEPRHSMHCYSYPWQKYVKLGSVLRHFAYTVAALHGCLESEIQAPTSVRSLFRNPCTRVAGEVAKVLQELAISIRNHHRCAPDVLSDHLHEALQDLNSAIRSQPRLFLGSKHGSANSRMLMELNSSKHTASRTTLPSFKTDTASLLERKNTKADQPSERNERSTLGRTLSKIAITSLEFSEALPFAAFASLLVEMVVRLELVIEEVKELERAANFREFTGHDHLTIDLTEEKRNNNGVPLGSHTVSTAAE